MLLYLYIYTNIVGTCFWFFILYSKPDRKERLRKRLKEADRTRDREREREQKREIRREQKRDRIATSKRDIGNEPLLDNNPDNVEQSTEPVCNSNKNIISTEVKEEATGFNSEDEYDENSFKNKLMTDEEWKKVRFNV